ncbi:MAG: serine hydrolase [Pyrinomonadaceae bacterium]|nr:serine hydrolase [Pyrinomonadaceae bacterium]
MARKFYVTALIVSFILSTLAATRGAAQNRNAAQALAIETSPKLQAMLDEAARTTLARFADKKFTEKNLAISLIDITDPKRPLQASFRGREPIYPASVVKMFYLAAAHRWLEDGKLKETPELKRALRDMIVTSSNDATQYIVDVLTGTSSGVELSEAEMREWGYKRNAVNRYFTTLGYTGINVNQKTYCEDSYGRERVFRGANGENRNKLTTDATARLLMEIATGRAITPERSRQMMELLKRDPFAPVTGGGDPDDQAHGFTGIAIPQGSRLWSKAGWTSTTRHDAAYVELPSGKRLVLVTFTTDHSTEREIIPSVARFVFERMNSVER